MAKVFSKYGMRLDVEFSYAQVGKDPAYPYIKVESMIKALDNAGKLWKFFGMGPEYDTLDTCRATLEDFWGKYRLMHGSHQVFQLAAESHLQLKNAWPVYLHGDEGTTYKKDGCLVLNIQSAIGCGTRSNKLGPLQDSPAVPHVNFVGHAFDTRFMLGALLRVSWA